MNGKNNFVSYLAQRNKKSQLFSNEQHAMTQKEVEQTCLFEMAVINWEDINVYAVDALQAI